LPNSIFKESDELKTYNKEKENIAKLTCIQNEGGSPSLIPNPKGGFQYQFGPKEQVLFNVEIVKLQQIIKIKRENIIVSVSRICNLFIVNKQ
jgi:hypothetical protein